MVANNPWQGHLSHRNRRVPVRQSVLKRSDACYWISASASCRRKRTMAGRVLVSSTRCRITSIPCSTRGIMRVLGAHRGPRTSDGSMAYAHPKQVPCLGHGRRPDGVHRPADELRGHRYGRCLVPRAASRRPGYSPTTLRPIASTHPQRDDPTGAADARCMAWPVLPRRSSAG